MRSWRSAIRAFAAVVSSAQLSSRAPSASGPALPEPGDAERRAVDGAIQYGWRKPPRSAHS